MAKMEIACIYRLLSDLFEGSDTGQMIHTRSCNSGQVASENFGLSDSFVD